MSGRPLAPRAGALWAGLVLVVLALPVIAVVALTGADTQGLWAHLANTVLSVTSQIHCCWVAAYWC